MHLINQCEYNSAGDTQAHAAQTHILAVVVDTAGPSAMCSCLSTGGDQKSHHSFFFVDTSCACCMELYGAL
jgi:hypothetical protein